MPLFCFPVSLHQSRLATRYYGVDNAYVRQVGLRLMMTSTRIWLPFIIVYISVFFSHLFSGLQSRVLWSSFTLWLFRKITFFCLTLLLSDEILGINRQSESVVRIITVLPAPASEVINVMIVHRKMFRCFGNLRAGNHCVIPSSTRNHSGPGKQCQLEAQGRDFYCYSNLSLPFRTEEETSYRFSGIRIRSESSREGAENH